jgi:hypothetical protein
VTPSRSSVGRVSSWVFAGLMLCVVIALAASNVSRMTEQGSRQRWRPPVDPRVRIVEGRFEVDTAGRAYPFGYRFRSSDGGQLSLTCVIYKGGKSYGAAEDCLDSIPEELRGQTVRVGYLDPVLDNGRASGDHLILKVWRGERLLLARPVDNTW